MLNKKIVGLLIFVIMLFSLWSLSSADSIAATWVTKSDMLASRYDLGIATVNNKIYAIGGTNGSASLNIVEEYDPSSNTWTTKKTMPTIKSAFATAVVDGVIYAIGGYTGSDPFHPDNLYTNSVYAYNPSEDSWSIKASMPTSREKCSAAVLEGKIFVVCGYNDGQLNKVEVYDPSLDSWSTKSNFPIYASYIRLTTVNNKLYAIDSTSIREYDSITDSWILKSNMLIARSWAGITSCNGKVYVIGGQLSSSSLTNSIEEYDCNSNTWKELPGMSINRCALGATEVNGKIFAVGGVNSGWSAQKTIEELTVVEQLQAPTELVVTAGDSKANLAWVSTTGSSITYNIKRSTTSGGPYTTISTTSAISFTDNSVTNGTTYYYVVSAVDSSGESADSNEASATPNSSAVSLDVTSIDKAKVGDEITANIVIKNAQNICAEDIKIVYDTTRLEYTGAENADGMKIYKEAALANGTQRYITACLGKTNAANGEKILFKLKFKAKVTGEAKIDIVNGRIADNATLEADVDQTNCGEKVVLIEASKDVNRTGEFTLLDLGIDAWYFGDAVTATDTTKYDADVVINNSIDDDDLTEIVNQMLSNSNYSPNV